MGQYMVPAHGGGILGDNLYRALLVTILGLGQDRNDRAIGLLCSNPRQSVFMNKPR